MNYQTDFNEIWVGCTTKKVDLIFPLIFSSIFEVTRDDIVFMASPLTFDPSIVEIFITLSRGARLLIVPYKMKMNPSDLLNMLVHRHRVTILQVMIFLHISFDIDMEKSVAGVKKITCLGALDR